MTYYRKSTSTAMGLNPFTEYAAVLLRQRHGDPRVTSSSELLFECDYTVVGRIANQVHKTFPVCDIDGISLVNAPQMYGMYLLRKEELQCSRGSYGTEVQEMELFHVTTKSKGIESLKNGLDWRRTRRSKFGRGVSFSDDADYADFYANNTSSEDDRRVIIVCAVLVSKTWRVNNNRNKNKQPGKELIVPPDTYDTTVSPNGRVFVKYYDYEFYPLYMVFYRRRPEYMEVSRYNNNNNKKKIGATPRRYTLEEMEKFKREEEEREWRQKEEEQLKRRQETQRKQQEARYRQQLEEEQQRQWQRQQWERQRREELARSHRDQQHRRQQNTNNDNSCHIL